MYCGLLNGPGGRGPDLQCIFTKGEETSGYTWQRCGTPIKGPASILQPLHKKPAKEWRGRDENGGKWGREGWGWLKRWGGGERGRKENKRRDHRSLPRSTSMRAHMHTHPHMHTLSEVSDVKKGFVWARGRLGIAVVGTRQEPRESTASARAVLYGTE